MEKFLLLIREDMERVKKRSKEQFDRDVQEMTRWVLALADAGNYVTSDPLLATGRYVSRDNVLSDGPFIESKEGISGFFIIRAENLDQAASIAQTCPHVLKGNMVIEVRPVMILENKPADG